MRFTYLFILPFSNVLLSYWNFTHLAKAHDIISTKICSTICNNGRVFTPFSPPVEPTCSSYISCSKCDFGTTTRIVDPSSVCSNIFSSNLSGHWKEQITLFYGKSHVLVPHSSTKSRLSEEENVKDFNKDKKKHGLFSIYPDWEKIEGVDASQCENGISEVEWTLYRTGIYRNWDITAIIETKPEATFPFCFENVEVPLDNSRSNIVGRKAPTSFKRLGSSIIGIPNAIRITKIIAVNQPEMKENPNKILLLLLKKYLSFRIMINGVTVKQIYLNTFHEKRESKSESEYFSDFESKTDEASAKSSSEHTDDRRLRISIDENFTKIKNSMNRLTEKTLDKIRGKSYTEPLILDSLLSFGFYSCFRVICNRKKLSESSSIPKLKHKVPLSIKTARDVHNKALNKHISLLPFGQTVPLPIYNSEYWTRLKEREEPEFTTKRVLEYHKGNRLLCNNYFPQINETTLEDKSIQGDKNETKSSKEISDKNETKSSKEISDKNETESSKEISDKNETESSKEISEQVNDFYDILALIAITNSEVLQDKVILNSIIKSDSMNDSE